jgi:hypothetical protein
LFFEFPHRRSPEGDRGREKRCTKPEEEGVPREGDAQALADRDSGEPVSSALRRACREGERGDERARGRRVREAVPNVEVRKPQGAESHERRGRQPPAFTGGRSAGAGLDSGVKAWKPELPWWRPMGGFGRGHAEVERHAGAGWSRGEPTRSEEHVSEGRIPRVPAR